MMMLLIASRVAAAIMISAVIFRLFPSAVRSLTKRAIHLDYFWLLFTGLMISRLIFQARNVFFTDVPDEPGEAPYLIFANAIAILCMFGVLKAYDWYNRDA